MNPNEVSSVLSFGLFMAGYGMFYYLHRSQRFVRRLARRWGEDTAKVAAVSVSRLILFLLAGVVPALLIPSVSGQGLAEYGLSFQRPVASLLWTAALSASAVVAVAAGKNPDTGQYPQYRIQEWSRGVIVLNVLTWALYLFAYELSFRGFMLQALLPYGAVTAITVNAALYVALHMPKGLREALAALPYGIVLCVVTLSTGTIWPAFVSHCALAMANFVVCFRANPSLRIRSNRRGE